MSFMVPEILHKFQMICLKGTSVSKVEQKPTYIQTQVKFNAPNA